MATAAGRTYRLRAQRFHLHLPVRYRPAGGLHWVESWTENISGSGVLFQVVRVMPPNSPIEMQLSLPREIAGTRAADVFCRGRVVRTVPPPRPDAQSALAATILEYRFENGREAMVH